MFLTFDKIKELCNKQGISLNQLEEKLNFSTNYIYSMKKGNPKVENLQKIADYFNVSTDYLLGRTDNPDIQHLSSDTHSTPQYRSIQRKAKQLSVADQERLLKLMDITFQDILNGGGDYEHHL